MGGGAVGGLGKGAGGRGVRAQLTQGGVRALTVGALGAVILATAGGVQGQSLSGSAASLDRQNMQARTHDFTYLATPGDVHRFVDANYLVQVGPNPDFELHDVSYPYARPEARLFIERLAAQYRTACGEKLVVTSLTRPLSDQPSNASDRSVHPTGMAIDFRRSNRTACRSWLESTALALEGQGVLEVTRERRPPHYHLVIYPSQYRSYVTRITGGSVRFADAPEADPALVEEWVTHVVRRGESLSRIASDYGAGVSRIRAENGIRGDRILVGQRLRVPVYRPALPETSVASRAPDPDPAPPEVPVTSQAPDPPTDASETVAVVDREASPEESPPDPPVDEGVRTHRVRSGESLWTIARDHGIDEMSLRRANAISGSRIFPGQELSIPSGAGGGSLASFEHTVRSGESLWTIARTYRVSVAELRAANGLSGSRILIGQRLTIPGAEGGGTIMRYTVRSGESLWTIANRYGTTVETLRRTNGIRSSRIFPGQTLNVPSGG